MVSCYQKKDGCLDPLATNFDPSADNTCCCNYPKIQILVSLNWGSDVFRYNKKYVDAVRDSVSFGYFGAFLRDIKLTDPMRLVYTNDEKLSVQCQINQSIQIASTQNDLLLVTRDRSENYTFGVWRIGNNLIDSLDFTIGLGELLPFAIEQNLESSNPLNKGGNIMYDSTNTRFRSLFLRYNTDIQKDSVSLIDPWDQKFKLSSTLRATIGEDLVVNIVWDLKKLFSGISFKNDGRSTIGNKIKTNIKNSINLK